MKLVWAPLALRRAAEARDWCAPSGGDAADRWVRRLLERVEVLRTHPELGRVIPEIGRPEFRELVHEGYRVMYRLRPRVVQLLTVRHGRQRFDLRELGLHRRGA